MATRATKFEFYEKVLVDSLDASLAPINGQLGAVLGKSIDDAGLMWGYAVHVYSSGECWSVREADLRPTGEFDVRETFYSGATMRVNLAGDRLE